MASVDRFLSGLTVTASLLSLIGTFFILICYMILPHKQHIRHALIVNLTLADFINAMNNTVSGLWVLAYNEPLQDGSGCVANGFIGQLSVQAVDCSILLITVVTLWIIRSRRITVDFNLTKIILICGSAWVLPVITSFLALGKKWFHPASANWCWLQDNPAYLRYVLTHGWRFVIIFIVTGCCIYIQIYLRRHLRVAAGLSHRAYQRQVDQPGIPSMQKLAKFRGGANEGTIEEDEEEMIGRGLKGEGAESQNSLPSQQRGNDIMLTPQGHGKPFSSFKVSEAPIPGQERGTTLPRIPKASNFFSARSATKKEKVSVEKTMLLNAYPIFYIILWIPGIANRIAEATGHEIYALQILQSTTQLIGFANAITFGWNERIGKHLKARFLEKVRTGESGRWTID